MESENKGHSLAPSLSHYDQNTGRPGPVTGTVKPVQLSTCHNRGGSPPVVSLTFSK